MAGIDRYLGGYASQAGGDRECRKVAEPPPFFAIHGPECEGRRVLTLFLTCDAIIRCNDPMQCPDPNCRICANSGAKTRWDN
jgi:hypothetical protein